MLRSAITVPIKTWDERLTQLAGEPDFDSGQGPARPAQGEGGQDGGGDFVAKLPGWDQVASDMMDFRVHLSPVTCHFKFKLTIAYDGTAYEGWQTQKIGTGVQQKVEEALAKLFPSRPIVHSSSRTDTGVHALGMVAHFEVPRRPNSK